MRALRITIFPRPVRGSTPVTTVIRDIDVNEPLEWIRNRTEVVDHRVLVLSDVFDLPDGTSIVEATLSAERRIRKDTERHMATLFHWDAMSLEISSPTGVISSTMPAPLDEDDVRYVLEVLAKHPAYRGQAVVVICKGWEVILGMRYGRVGKLGANVRPILEGAQEKVTNQPTPRDEALVREIDLALGTTN